MANRRVLDRLLRLRKLEEEQSRLDLEPAAGERNRRQRELDTVVERRALARSILMRSIDGEAGGESCLIERMAGIVEIGCAERQRTGVELRFKEAESEEALRREEFLDRRTGRRQVETLVDEACSASETDAERKAQQGLDDWYGRRVSRRSNSPMKSA